MKFIFKAAIIACLVLAGISYVNYLKTGKFAMPITFSKPELSIPKIKTPTLPSWQTEESKIAYKWLDQSGRWQYTSEPPKGDTPYETIKALPVTK